MRKISGLIGTLALALAVASCGGGGNGGSGPPPPPAPPPPPPPPTCPAGTFCMTASSFTSAAGPAGNPTVTVAPNAAVTWTNDSGTIHNVIFATPAAALAAGGGSGGNIPDHSSGSNQRQFAAAGSYPFHCSIHGTPTSGMRGSVTVQ